jgi:molybdopterin/thiamine biosynthesis adenylyltransferase
MFTTSPNRIVTEKLPPTDARFSVTHRQELMTGFCQENLTRATGILIGAGGIGSEIGEGLCRKGVGRLRIFDHDVVEHTNLNRQLFFPPDIGQNKACCLARNLDPHCHAGTILEGYPMSFEDAVALKVDLSAAFVVCGVDNSEARVAVSRHYHRLGTPVIFVAVDLLAECGHVFVQKSTSTAPCFGCAFPRSLVGRKAPCFLPASKDVLKAVAGFALYAIDSVLMDRKRNWNFRRIHLAGYAPDVLLNIEKNPNCPLCFSGQQGSPAVGASTVRASTGDVPPLTPNDTQQKH